MTLIIIRHVIIMYLFSDFHLGPNALTWGFVCSVLELPSLAQYPKMLNGPLKREREKKEKEKQRIRRPEHQSTERWGQWA
jgi:hypothetical protein